MPIGVHVDDPCPILFSPAAVGWIMALSSIVMIPIIALIRFCLASGSLGEVSETGSGSFYTERQPQCCDVASDLTLINLLRFLNKPRESFQKWIITPVDKI